MKTPRNELDTELFGPDLLESCPVLINAYQLEEFIFNLNDENVEKCAKLINNVYIETKYSFILSIIYYVSEHRPFSWPFLAKIFEKIPPPKSQLKGSNFVYFLVKKGALNEKYCSYKILTQATAEDLEGEFPRLSLERSIRDDDLDRIATLSAEPFFFKTKIKLKEKEVDLVSAAAFYSSTKCFKFLMINQTEFTTETSEFAVMGGNQSIINFCLQKECSFKGLLPLAIEYHHNEVGKWILEKFGLETIDIIHCIRSYNTLAVAFLSTNKFYIKEKTVAHVRPLMVAAENNRLEYVEYLLACGAKLSSKDKEGVSALLRAAKCGYLDIIEFLVQKGANIEDSDKEGTTPLLHATCRKHVDALKFLLSKGANPNRRDKEGRSPLYRAMQNRDLEVVDILLDNGANVEEDIRGGQTPLIYAASNGCMDILKTLIKHGAEVDACDLKGMTALMYAAEEWYIEIIQVLIRSGADTSLKDIRGMTARQHTYSSEIRDLLRISV